MATNFRDPVRNVVPRWRPFSDEVRLGTLTASRTRQILIQPDDSEVKSFQFAWKRSPSSTRASEFVAAAIAHGIPEIAHDAAHSILSFGDEDETILGSLARSLVVNGAGHLSGEANQPVSMPSVQAHWAKIAAHKNSLRRFPSNPLRWADLSLLYTSLGQVGKPGRVGKAERAMRVALALAMPTRYTASATKGV